MFNTNNISNEQESENALPFNEAIQTYFNKKYGFDWCIQQLSVSGYFVNGLPSPDTLKNGLITCKVINPERVKNLSDLPNNLEIFITKKGLDFFNLLFSHLKPMVLEDF